MAPLKQKLRPLLKNAARIAIIGIGSELRGDDAVGLLVLDYLRKLKTKSAGCRPHDKSKGSRGRAGQPVPPSVSVGQGQASPGGCAEASCPTPHGKSKIVAGVACPEQGRRGDPGPAFAKALRLGRPASARPATVFGCSNRTSRSGPTLKLFNGGTAPENLTGEIRRFNPSHLIMIDAVELGKRPGTVKLIDLKKTANTVFLTHKLPVKLMLDFMAAEMEFKTIFIGIQPKSLDFGAPVSKPVMRAGRELADWLLSVFGAKFRTEFSGCNSG